MFSRSLLLVCKKLDGHNEMILNVLWQRCCRKDDRTSTKIVKRMYSAVISFVIRTIHDKCILFAVLPDEIDDDGLEMYVIRLIIRIGYWTNLQIPHLPSIHFIVAAYRSSQDLFFFTLDLADKSFKTTLEKTDQSAMMSASSAPSNLMVVLAYCS